MKFNRLYQPGFLIAVVLLLCFVEKTAQQDFQAYGYPVNNNMNQPINEYQTYGQNFYANQRRRRMYAGFGQGPNGFGNSMGYGSGPSYNQNGPMANDIGNPDGPWNGGSGPMQFNPNGLDPSMNPGFNSPNNMDPSLPPFPNQQGYPPNFGYSQRPRRLRGSGPGGYHGGSNRQGRLAKRSRRLSPNRRFSRSGRTLTQGLRRTQRREDPNFRAMQHKLIHWRRRAFFLRESQDALASSGKLWKTLAFELSRFQAMQKRFDDYNDQLYQRRKDMNLRVNRSFAYTAAVNMEDLIYKENRKLMRQMRSKNGGFEKTTQANLVDYYAKKGNSPTNWRSPEIEDIFY